MSGPSNRDEGYLVEEGMWQDCARLGRFYNMAQRLQFSVFFRRILAFIVVVKQADCSISD